MSEEKLTMDDFSAELEASFKKIEELDYSLCYDKGSLKIRIQIRHRKERGLTHDSIR